MTSLFRSINYTRCMHIFPTLLYADEYQGIVSSLQYKIIFGTIDNKMLLKAPRDFTCKATHPDRDSC